MAILLYEIRLINASKQNQNLKNTFHRHYVEHLAGLELLIQRLRTSFSAKCASVYVTPNHVKIDAQAPSLTLWLRLAKRLAVLLTPRRKPGSFSRPPGEEAVFPSTPDTADDENGKRKKHRREPGWYQANIMATELSGVNPYDKSRDPDRPQHHYGGGCGHEGPRTTCPVHGDNCCWGGNENTRFGKSEK